jgi:hypothetical protein
MGKDKAYGQGICTMDMNMVMQCGLAYAAWTWTYSIDMDRDMQCRHVEADVLFRYHEDGSKKLNACNRFFLCMVYF